MTDARHPLRGLVLAQFAGSFNDNAWKLIVSLLAIGALRAGATGASDAAIEAGAQGRATFALAALTLPMLLVSLPAGILADRYSKRSLILAAKVLELLLLLAGTVCLWIDPRGWIAPIGVLALLGAQAALLSPARYGILPEIVPHDRLSAGNALVESWSFLAIIAGNAVAGAILAASGARPFVAGAALVLLSCGGLLAARAIPRVAPAGARRGLRESVAAGAGALRSDRVLRLAVLGQAFFWGIAALLGQDVLVYVKTVLHTADALSGLPLAAFGLGVGAGAVLAARLSGSKVEYGLIPLGAIGMAIFAFAFGAAAPAIGGTIAVMFGLGAASGFLIVPLNALIQWRAPSDRRGAVIALANVFTYGAVLLGSLAAGALARGGFSSRAILLGAALLILAGTIWALKLLPDALLRLVLILLTRSVYRLRVVGRQHVPEEGGALLVPNHVSFVDGLFLIAALDRPVRFLVDAEYFEHPLLRPFVRSLGAIPISSGGGPRMLLRALRDAGGYLDRGEVVCIFAEGQITRTGLLLPFRRGLERIVKGRTAPIIPVHLDRVWGSIFSRAHGRFVTKIPERIPYPVTLSFGAPLPPDAPIHLIRRAVHDLGEAAWEFRKAECRPLHHRFVRACRRRPLAFAMADGRHPRVSRFRALVSSIALSRALRRDWEGQEHVGILLPPSVGGALANTAAALAGRRAVNLNFTTGRSGLQSAARQAGLRTVVTSAEFLEKAKVELPEGVRAVRIEEVVAGVGRGARLVAFLLAALAPVRFLERRCGAMRRILADDVAAVIFSSGSTGEPKGVLLRHFNIDSNVEAAAQVFRLEPRDRVLGILPLFHSFGSQILWMGMTRRVGIVFHPSPLDAAAIGGLVQRYAVTLMVATPTFLQLYMRRCSPAQLGSLRVVLTGAEKLPERLAAAFEDTFGIRPLEGYGATECAPVIAVSAPDFRAPGFYQPGSRRGFVGQPLPGVAVRVVDPEVEGSLDPLPPNTAGLLLVKGPNVMQGYLGRDDLTAQVMRDGWYVTGDMAIQDEDGFLQITDRLSRFSKIGGEMVPHGRVEEALHDAAGATSPVFAVTAVPDARKGEALAVLHTLKPEEIPPLLARLAATGLPNLFIPRPDHFVAVEKIPVLGTGKIDLREVKRIARAAWEERSRAVETGA